MKLLKITLSLTFLAMTLLFSCKPCECPGPVPMITQYNLDKSVVEVNTTNVATGFESVFRNNITDSAQRAHFSQVFVDAARFYPDKSGYFFIETLNDAWVVAHINHDLIGTSRIDVKDENGKYFIQEIVETVEYSTYGFVEYFRKNPSSLETERKLSFVTSIPSAQWFIGTGFYGGPSSNYYDIETAQRTILYEAVNTMAVGIGGIFDNFYTEENDQIGFCRDFVDHIRFFDDGSGYFFINDFDGINIAHGANKGHEGENDYDLRDEHGSYIIRDMIEIAKNDGSGYYEYFWVNPASGNEERKISFVARIPGTEYFVGAGFYSN
jgi:signal transduction histidine kinase